METKEWTLMFYFASDNPLASTIVSQLKALKDAGYHPDANVIARFDPHVVNTPVHVFDVNAVNKFWEPGQSEVGFTPNNPFVRDLVLDRLWDTNRDNEEIRKRVVDGVKKSSKYKDMEYDPPRPNKSMSGEQAPKDALPAFLNFCRETYPARHYVLFILGHGQVVGNDSLLYDDNATEKSLSLTQLGQHLREFNEAVKKHGGQVELIGLHSCSMSALEVAYELEGAANYMLASQGPSYVGSWPYKQILIRIFNDLNSELTVNEINGFHEGRDGKRSLVEKLIGEEPVSKFVREALKAETKKLLSQYRPGTQPDAELVKDIVKDVNELLKSKELAGNDVFLKIDSSNGTHQLRNLDRQKFNEASTRRFNRLLLAEVYPEIPRYPSIDVDTMFSKIFYYCVYNSYDFQLAGYPYDLCLTNLKVLNDKKTEINNTIDKLVASLIAGLDDTNPVPKQLMLLAHWDAQSFYQEDYVDLYDFCFRVEQRFKDLQPNLNTTPALDQILDQILDACKNMRAVLEKGSNKLISQSAFSGAAFQYSHGLSIYFPWARPVASEMWDNHYKEYQLIQKTNWKNFLEVYFEKTRRQTRAVETGKKPQGEPSSSADILTLMGQIGARVFDHDGQLQKPGPDSPMGKWGPDDPTGSYCDCPTIKNYPLYTGELPASDDFLDAHEKGLVS